MNQTEALLRAFVRTDRVPRYLALLAKRSGRAKLRAQLAHLTDLDPRFARPVSGADATAANVTRLLTELGAPPTCYCLSEDATLDHQELPLAEALERVVGRGMGTFLSCLPGKLGYYEAEGPRERYILVRAAV